MPVVIQRLFVVVLMAIPALIFVGPTPVQASVPVDCAAELSSCYTICGSAASRCRSRCDLEYDACVLDNEDTWSWSDPHHAP